MIGKFKNSERGFTVIEIGVVALFSGIVMVFAIPKINDAMREYRLNAGMRYVADSLKQARMQAVSDNRKSGLAVDLAGRRVGVVAFNDDDTINRIQWMPLPDGVSFQRPSGFTSNPDGVTTNEVLSFEQQGGLYRQDFNSRGFPMVAFGESVAIFVGNGKDYRAVTMSSVGGVRTYRAEDSTWVNTRSAHYNSETGEASEEKEKSKEK